MKVLTFTTLFPNTLRPNHGLFVFQRMEHFARRPVNNIVRVVAPVPYRPEWLPGRRWQHLKYIPQRENIGGLEVFHPRYPLLPHVMPLHGLLMFLGTLACVRRLHEAEQFDCIDAHYVYPDGIAAVLLGKLLKMPVFLTARGTDINLFSDFPTIRPMIRWALRKSAGVVAVSEALRKKILTLDVDPRKVTVIGNGVDSTRFYPLDRAEARRRLSLEPAGKILLSVGSLVPVKGHDLLIGAFSRLRRLPDTRLYLVGAGICRSRLEAQARELGLAERVIFVGAKQNPELHLWYSAADLLCLSSLREGWPNVLLEAMACGTPVVATAVGGVPEIVSSSQYGLLAAPEAGDLAEKIESALITKWTRDALVEFTAKRSWHKVAAEVEQFFISGCTPKIRAAGAVSTA